MPDRGISNFRLLTHAGIRCWTCYYFGRRLLRRLRSRNKRMRTLYDGFREDAWLHAAERLGARYTPLPDDLVEIELGGRCFRLGNGMPSLDDSQVVKRCGDKPEVHLRLARAGIPVPHHIVIGVAEFERALAMLRSSPVPLVVKPADGTGGGAGVSTNVTTVQQLKRAVAWGRAYGARLLVEEQVRGDCYRILVMDGEVLDALLRKAPSIVGDGVSTIHRLIRRENRLRLAGGTARAQYLIQIDPDLRNTLASQGFTVRSLPAKGGSVVLKGVVNANGSRDNFSAGRYLCPAILECARRATQVVGARLAGVDVICEDPSVPLQDSNGAVVEINTPPGFHCHYYAADSRVLAADRILDRFFNTLTDSEAAAPPPTASCTSAAPLS